MFALMCCHRTGLFFSVSCLTVINYGLGTKQRSLLGRHIIWVLQAFVVEAVRFMGLFITSTKEMKSQPALFYLFFRLLAI